MPINDLQSLPQLCKMTEEEEISPFLSSHVSSYHTSPTQMTQDWKMTRILTGDLTADFLSK